MCKKPLGREHFTVCIVLAVLGSIGCSLGLDVCHDHQQEQYWLIPSPGQAWPTDVTVVITCKAQISHPPSHHNFHLLHNGNRISRNSTKYTVMISDDMLRNVVYIHNFAGSDTGTYTCRARFATARGHNTSGEHTTVVAINSSHTPCDKKRERASGRDQSENANMIHVTIDISIAPRVLNPVQAKPPATQGPDPVLPLIPATTSATEYGTKSTRPSFTSPSQSSDPNRTVLGPQNTPTVPKDREKFEIPYLWIVIGALLATFGIFFIVAVLICIGTRKLARKDKPNSSYPLYEEVQAPSPSPYEVPRPNIQLDTRRNSHPEHV